MSAKKHDSGQIIAMVLVSLISQITVLMRSSVVAGIFGASFEMDAFNLSNSIVSFMFGFVASGITTIVLPEYVKNPKNKNITSFIVFIYSIVAFLIVIVFVLRFQILSIATNRDELFIALASSVLGVLLIANGISSVTSIAVAYSQSKGSFVIPKVISLMGQVITLFTVYFLRESITIYSYAVAMTGGLLFDSAVNVLLSMRLGWRIYPSFHFRNDDTKVMISRFIPLLFSAGIYQLSLFVDSIIAANLEVGKITVLGYSSQIIGMINSVIIVNLTTYFYPRIIRHISDADVQSYFWRITALLHLLICMIICGFLAVGNEGIAFIFEHGSFDSQTTHLVFVGASIYMIGQQTNIVRDLIYRYFYANGNTKIPVENSAIVSVSNIFISIIMVHFIGFYGIIIGTISASMISLICILFRFQHFYSFKVPVGTVLMMYARNIITMCLSVLSVVFLKRYLVFPNHLLTIAVYGIITVLIFAAFSMVLCRDILAFYKERKN